MCVYYAQVDKGLVVNVIDFDPTGRFEESIEWFPCNQNTKVGDIYVPDEGVIYTSELSLDEEKELTYELIRRIGKYQMKQLTKDFDETEIQTWPIQVDEVTSLMLDPNADAVFLRTLAAKRRISFDVLCQRVMVQNKQFRYMSALIIGERQYFEDLVKGCSNLAELQRIRREVLVWQQEGSKAV